jgi:uncharacterized protein DUF6528
VRVFRLVQPDDGGARLEDAGRIGLPQRGGHDLYPVSGTAYLSLSTGKKCWLLDRDSGQVLPHPELADMARIKSMCVNPLSGQQVWTQAEGENWWTSRIMMLEPENMILMPEQKIYKVRWME